MYQVYAQQYCYVDCSSRPQPSLCTVLRSIRLPAAAAAATVWQRLLCVCTSILLRFLSCSCTPPLRLNMTPPHPSLLCPWRPAFLGCSVCGASLVSSCCFSLSNAWNRINAGTCMAEDSPDARLLGQHGAHPCQVLLAGEGPDGHRGAVAGEPGPGSTRPREGGGRRSADSVCGRKRVL